MGARCYKPPRARRSFVRHFLPNLADETGSEIVEFGLVLLPLMAFVFLIIDVAWICFAQESLQYAVETGVRAAVVRGANIPLVVQQNAMGFLAGANGLSEISICYMSPTNLNPSQCLSGLGSNAGGNVVQISVKNVSVSSLGPILRQSSPAILLNATSSDVMEGAPSN